MGSQQVLSNTTTKSNSLHWHTKRIFYLSSYSNIMKLNQFVCLYAFLGSLSVLNMCGFVIDDCVTNTSLLIGMRLNDI